MATASERRIGQRVHVDGVVLAELLADRLHQVVPPAYAVVADRGLLMIGRRDGSGGGGAARIADIVDQPGDALIHVVSACRRALDLVKDVVVGDTADLWPGTVPTSPGVAIGGRQIRLWYGSELVTGPVLELRPIVLH